MSAPTEGARVFSPITLNHEWSQVNRLLFAVICYCIGALMNCFFIASFFVEDALMRIGFVFLACVGLSDLIVTALVMPVTAVVLLSGEWDTITVCYALQFLTEASTYSYSLFFTMVAAETYYRLCRTLEEYEEFMSMRVGVIAILGFAVSFAVAGIGVYHGLDYDYCQREHFGNFYFRVSTDVLFHVIPGLYILYCLITSNFSMHRRAQEHGPYRRSQQYENDRSTNNLNIAAYLLYASAWIPYLFVVYEDPGAPDSRFYTSVWLGICRSVITSFLYGIFERSFRRAFAYLFNYCCLKSTFTGSYAGHHRRTYEYNPPTREVRVHILQSGINSSPQRAASSTRETQEL